jgi:hypothetical protein
LLQGRGSQALSIEVDRATDVRSIISTQRSGELIAFRMSDREEYQGSATR